MKLIVYINIIIFYIHNGIFKCNFLDSYDFNLLQMPNIKMNYFNHNNIIKYAFLVIL